MITILRANALALPLADSSVDLVVTSPPYFGLRSYQDGGEHYEGQIGSEATPAEFLDALIAATREMVRVLKPSGSIFVNLGDRYSDKTLLMVPERYRIRAVDELGLIARAVVIWSKPNGLPESVTDRVRRSHEDWVHLTKRPRYYSAVDEIREPHRSKPGREGKGALGGQKSLRPVGPNSGSYNTLGALPGSVWTIPTEPLRVPESLGIDHFAAFPTEWPRRIIQGWSPREVCTACGEGRRPVVSRRRETFYGAGRFRSGAQQVKDGAAEVGWAMDEKWRSTVTITGYACACPDTSAPATPGRALDPFGGTGTTALVADVLGRHGISVDMSQDYCRLAQWRTTDPKQRAKAARVEAVEPVSDDQPSLLEEESA